jgi:hypothetical protein
MQRLIPAMFLLGLLAVCVSGCGQLTDMVADIRDSVMRRTGVASCIPCHFSQYIIPGKTIGMVIQLPSITGQLTALPVWGILRVSTAAFGAVSMAGTADTRALSAWCSALCTHFSRQKG